MKRVEKIETMDFVDEIKINRVNNVVLVSCSPSSVLPAATSGADDDLTETSAGTNGADVQSWSGRRLEGTLVLTGHHTLVSSNANDREEIWLLHSNIDTIEVRGPGTGGSGSGGGLTAAPLRWRQMR